MIAAGIDLSGRTKGTTALAWVEGDPPRVVEVVADRGLRENDELARRCLERAPEVVAIDAPLSLPHVVTCTKRDCPRCAPDARYGSREVDGKSAWAKIGHVEKPPMPTVMLAAIAFRAIHLRRLLQPRAHVIETWPMGTYRALARGEPHGDTGDDWRRRLLEALGLVVEGSTDRLDAVAAAYAGWRWLNGSAALVEADGDEIWIATRPAA